MALIFHYMRIEDARENCKQYVSMPSVVYEARYEKYWLESDVVLRALMEIDELDLRGKRFADYDRAFTEIATGTKMIMLAEWCADKCWISSLNLGENCYKYILEISRKHDVHVVCVHTPEYDELEELEIDLSDYEVVIANTGKRVLSCDDILDYSNEWLPIWEGQV